MKLTQLKLYAVVARGANGRLEILTHGREYALMVYTKRSEAISARVEEAAGDATLLDAWKIVTFTADGFMTTKQKAKETRAAIRDVAKTPGKP